MTQQNSFDVWAKHADQLPNFLSLRSVWTLCGRNWRHMSSGVASLYPTTQLCSLLNIFCQSQFSLIIACSKAPRVLQLLLICKSLTLILSLYGLRVGEQESHFSVRPLFAWGTIITAGLFFWSKIHHSSCCARESPPFSTTRDGLLSWRRPTAHNFNQLSCCGPMWKALWPRSISLVALRLKLSTSCEMHFATRVSTITSHWTAPLSFDTVKSTCFLSPAKIRTFKSCLPQAVPLTRTECGRFCMWTLLLSRSRKVLLRSSSKRRKMLRLKNCMWKIWGGQAAKRNLNRFN